MRDAEEAPRAWQRVLPAVLTVALAAVGILVLHHELRRYRYRDIATAVQSLPASAVAIAIALTASSYVVLTWYDRLALRYVGRPLPAPRVTFVSFIAYAFSQTLGFPLLTGGTVRYRLYTASGLTTIDIAHAVTFTSATFWLGVLTIGGGVLIADPATSATLLHVPPSVALVLGPFFVAISVAYLALTALRRAPISIRGWELPVPRPLLSAGQLLLSTADWTLAGAVLYVLLPVHLRPAFPGFLSAFLLAQVAGLVSHVPGGLGVFDSIMLLLLEDRIPASSLLASLVVFRVVYYLLPFAVAATMLAGAELHERRDHVWRAARVAGTWVLSVTPQVLAVTTFLGGMVLLVSGATPAVGSRLRWLDAFLPLAVIEMSHFLASVVGMGLVIVAWGLQRRLDAAYHLTVILLAVGIGTSLLKGLDYEEAAALTVILAVLLPARRHFYRRTSLTAEPLTAEWVAAMLVAVGATVWLGIFAYKRVNYTDEMWWRFALRGDAPRFLRATVGVLALAVSFAIARLLRHAPAEAEPPTAADIERASAVAMRAADTAAQLALLGDKSLLFSDSGNAFLMYAVAGRSWVALGDPVGASDDCRELAWRFREMVHHRGGWPVFYLVAPETLPLYIDLGLTLLKVGERARVPLAGFSLEGGARKGMRRTLRGVEKEGCRFEVVPAADVAALLPDLRRVSDGWLAAKRTREKGFSLGFFDEQYLCRFPAAIVRRGDRVVAFANVLEGAEREELSVDLMRFDAAAPPGTMEYLFAELMLWGHDRGYQWFDLGMAPLAGLENRALAPLWNRMGALLFRHGENFYNFQGLREYKQKFDPVWEPRYLASPGGLVLPRIVTNLATLISGGMRGLVAK